MATLTMTQDAADDGLSGGWTRQPASPPRDTAVPVSGPGVVLGRVPDQAQVVLPLPSVSRRHARGFEEGGAFYVEDLGSRHGTLLNGRPVTGRSRLADGDRIQITQYVFVFRA